MEIESVTQWHPAFCAAIELELREDKKILRYEREHNLSKMPLRIDLLVIKKSPDEIIKNEIGDFFKGNNIMEFKSPDDEVNIDTFYKVLSYACIYKSETGNVDEVKDTDITISLIREGKPVKLLEQLDAKYGVKMKTSGIYRIDKMLFPLQIIVTRELNPKSHVWLKALSRSLKHDEAENLICSFEELKEEEDKQNADAVMNLTVGVNEPLFRQILEDKDMGEALKKILEPELMLVISNMRTEIADKDAAINNMRTEIADKDAAIADKDAAIADKDATIADKDAEIELLRNQLAQYNITNVKKNR